MNKLNICEKEVIYQRTIPVLKEIGGIAIMPESKTEPAKLDIKIMHPDRERFYVDIDIDSDVKICVGCGDDRCMCKGSKIEGLDDDYNTEHFIRVFGGPFGLAHTLLLNLLSLDKFNDQEILDKLSSHKEAVMLVIERLKSAGVMPLLHSDMDSEGGDRFRSDFDNDIGCAFAKKLGIITDLMHQEFVLSAAEQVIDSQGGDSRGIVKLMQAKQELIQAGIDQGFKYGRKDFNELDAPVAVLEGKHAPAKITALVLNYKNKISKPAAGAEAFYDVDVLVVAKLMIKLFPEIDFDPERLIQSIELQSVTTARALAMDTRGDDLGIEILDIEKFGERQDALEELSSYIENKKATINPVGVA